MTEQQPIRRIYFDSNALIYAIEGKDEISAVIHQLFAVIGRQSEPAYTSELTLAEVLPKANVIQQRSYITMILHSGLFGLLPVTREILIETADYRRSRARPALHSRVAMPKLADSIHVVSAMRARCDTFISLDRGIQLPEGLHRVGHEEGKLRQLVQELS